jgi:hypothetical protein
MEIMPLLFYLIKRGIMHTIHEQHTQLGWPQELATIFVDATGKLNITNTGGTSASEGGMGTGGGPEKGPGIESPTGDKDGAGTKNQDDGTWDPLKPKEEKEKDNS